MNACKILKRLLHRATPLSKLLSHKSTQCPSRAIKSRNPIQHALQNPSHFKIPQKISKAPRNHIRNPSSYRSENSSEEETDEEREREREKLPNWVEIPTHCASDVKTICTLLSTDKDSNIDTVLRGFRHRLSPDLVLGVLRNYRRIGKQKTLEFFSWAGSQRNYMYDNAVVDYMADFFGRRKLFDDLKCLLKAMSAPGFDLVTSRTVAIAVRFLGRAGRVEEALSVFEAMENGVFNCVPTNLVYNNVLYVLCKCNVVDEENLVACIEKGLSLFRKMENPDCFSYSNVIIGLCKIGRVEQALGIFDEMCRYGVSPSRTAVNNLVGRLCEANKNDPCVHNVEVGSSFKILIPSLRSKNHLDQAMRVFWKVGDMGVLPSVFVVKMLIDEVCNSGKVAEALRIYNYVLDKGPRLDEETHYTILQVFLNLGRIEEASGVFSRMISEGLRPKVLMYNSVISAICKAGHMRDAEEYFHTMKKTRRLPNNVTYTALIHGHCKADNWQAASSCLDELLGLGWCPHSPTFNLVDSLLRKAKKDDVADKLWLKMVCLHVQKECKVGEWEAAYQKVTEILERGFSPHVYTLDLVDRALRKAGKWEMAQDLLMKAERVVAK